MCVLMLARCYGPGQKLWDVLNHLRTHPGLYGPDVAVSWADGEPMLHNIVISTSSASTTNPSPIPHLRLVFSGDSQTLLLIEILSQTLISKLEWAGRPLIDSTSTAYSNIQRLLNAKFGPTYPSTSHPAFGTGTGYTHEQILTYPGVVFGFPSNSPQDRLTRVIVSRHDPSVPHAGAFPDIKQLEKLKPTLAAAGDVDRVEIIVRTPLSSSCSLVANASIAAIG